MKNLFLLSILTVGMMFNTFGQNQKKKITFTCNYFGKNILPQDICPQIQGFVSDSHAEKVIGQFAQKMGQVSSKFKVMQCGNTDNCFATVIEGQPYIIYDRDFLNRVEETTQTDWAAVSILAHEIGHHANFHTIDGTGSRPEKEMEADYFSGFWLHEMGASLEQSEEAIKHFQGEFVTTTHPPRSQRLMAIENGWKAADKLHPSNGKYSPQQRTQVNQPIGLPVSTVPTNPRVPTTTTQQSPRVEKRREVQEADIKVENITVNSTSLKKTGCVSGDCSNGNGIFVHETQGSYKGSWLNGRRHGYGIQYYPNGQKMFIGEYNQGKRQGSGTFFFKNGERFEGHFNNDKITDNGSFIMKGDEENNEVELLYIRSDGMKEIIRVENLDEEEE
ncbi:MAG: hypothetical protein U5N85_21610 [Arcicella sp.]|nr:hypothetical protein [Arcicella sp.]